MRRKTTLKSINMPKLRVTLFVLILLPMLVPCEVFAKGKTTRVSVSSAGEQANSGSSSPSISSDCRYVAFSSDAYNLVDGDLGFSPDIFVHDRQTGQTTLVSVSSKGVQGNLTSSSPSISSDGRYVAFSSRAWNLVDDLVEGDSDMVDIFVHDRQTGQTTLVSVSSTGLEPYFRSYSSSISSDGRYLAFNFYTDDLVDGDSNFRDDIFVHDRQTGQTTLVSVSSTGVQANANSSSPSISSDGRYVAFSSFARNLVDGDLGFSPDIFVHDRQTGQTTLVSVSSTGVQANSESSSPSISSDGRYVAFESEASNLVDGDSNRKSDIFVHDRLPVPAPAPAGHTLPWLLLLLLGD
jgi:Tol biopolymer transport system component